MHLLSVIIPIYNSENTLSRCITSILSQNYINLDILLLDDGSTDRTAEICHSFVKKDPRCRYFQLNHGGVSAARREGLLKASGEYICFADADDELMPNAYDKMIALMTSNQADIGVCGYYTIKESIRTPIIPSAEGCHTSITALSLLFTDEGVSGFLWNKIYKRSLLTSTYFDSSLQYCEDLYANVLFLSQSNCTVAFLQEPLYLYYFVSGSVTAKHQYFTADSHFCYAPAFEKIAGIAHKLNIQHLVATINCKYTDILEYSMYSLLTESFPPKTDILRLKTILKRNLPKALFHSGKSIRQKFHSLTLAFCPIIYAKIRL
ncbi:MAG: glycosyltransferase [Lachnospiraceae bacterium]|nr:glycosyltransferase [Lachnospiraceae bacterium]